MRRPAALLPVVVPVVSSCLLLGCSARQPGTVAAARDARPAAAMAPASAKHAIVARAADAEAVAHVRATLDETYEQGLAAWMAGDVDRAFDLFDRALAPVLDAPFDVKAHPELDRRVEEVLAAIHDLTVESADTGADVGEDLALASLAPSELDARTPVPAPAASLAGAATVSRETYVIPMKDHPAVDAMVRFYTGRAKDRFELGLARSGRYMPTVKRILREEGVPGELCWLALVESNYNAKATSHARAHGLWQFIPSTGQRYGMDRDFWIDERADFEKATRAAARYLRFLHGEFDDWHLALAAYNAGEGRVGRGIRNTGRHDYWHLRETRWLRNETKTYVPAFLAILRIVENPAAHGIDFRPDTPYSWATVTVPDAVDLDVVAETAGCTRDELEALNPELKRGCTPAGRRYALRVPSARANGLETRLASLPPEKRLRWRQHVVRRGDTLSGIATAHGSTVSAIMAANDVRNAHRISVGASLLVPTGPGASHAASMAARRTSGSSKSTSKAVRTAYRVRPGDTLSAIARRHGTTVSQVAGSNGLRNTDRIKVGQRLTILAEPAKATHHVVQRGDTLVAIARRHGCSVSDLRAWNALPPSGLIHPGQKLAVVGASAESKTHTVRPGDTLFDIARAYRTTVDKIRSWNDLNRRRYIHPGERLTIFSH